MSILQSIMSGRTKGEMLRGGGGAQVYKDYMAVNK